jgi:hypothetical protein
MPIIILAVLCFSEKISSFWAKAFGIGIIGLGLIIFIYVLIGLEKLSSFQLALEKLLWTKEFSNRIAKTLITAILAIPFVFIISFLISIIFLPINYNGEDLWRAFNSSIRQAISSVASNAAPEIAAIVFVVVAPIALAPIANFTSRQLRYRFGHVALISTSTILLFIGFKLSTIDNTNLSAFDPFERLSDTIITPYPTITTVPIMQEVRLNACDLVTPKEITNIIGIQINNIIQPPGDRDECNLFTSDNSNQVYIRIKIQQWPNTDSIQSSFHLTHLYPKDHYKRIKEVGDAAYFSTEISPCLRANQCKHEIDMLLRNIQVVINISGGENNNREQQLILLGRLAINRVRDTINTQ